jgi:hypothetical protein
MKRLAAVLLLASFAMPTLADIAFVRGATIERTMVIEGSFGGCMVLLDKSIADAGLACPANNNWVSLDCDGVYVSKVSGQRAFDSAQMALALGKNINIQVDDSKKHNNYCVAVRLDLIN